MIIIRLIGGIGNQMFQYALGRRLTLDRGVPLKLDLRAYDHQELRKFELDKFNVDFQIASDEDIYKTRFFSQNRVFRKFMAIWQKQLPYYKQRTVKEKKFSAYDDNIINVPSTCYISGFWQSKKYFAAINNKLTKEFTLKGLPSSISTNWISKIKSNTSISIHVRRGDYVNNKDKNNLHNALSLDYYYSAVNFCLKRIPSCRFFIFSDDIDWCSRSFTFINEPEFVYVDRKNRDVEELVLMSLCNHHIIANSSYSWWGAWLNPSTTKMVISPEKWFINSTMEILDLIPDTWLRM